MARLRVNAFLSSQTYPRAYFDVCAEFNVLCDPEAAQIVLNAPVKKTMIPINVTHTALVTHDIHSKILGGSNYNGFTLPPPTSNLRYTLSTLITFFADTYKHTFGFNSGPPLHDALTIAYIAHPEFFTCRRYRVDVELSGTHSLGQTVVDIWNYSGATEDSWGPEGKNCLVAESLDVRCPIPLVSIAQPPDCNFTPRSPSFSSSSWNALTIVTPNHPSTDGPKHRGQVEVSSSPLSTCCRAPLSPLKTEIFDTRENVASHALIGWDKAVAVYHLAFGALMPHRASASGFRPSGSRSSLTSVALYCK